MGYKKIGSPSGYISLKNSQNIIGYWFLFLLPEPVVHGSGRKKKI